MSKMFFFVFTMGMSRGFFVKCPNGFIPFVPHVPQSQQRSISRHSVVRTNKLASSREQLARQNSRPDTTVDKAPPSDATYLVDSSGHLLIVQDRNAKIKVSARPVPGVHHMNSWV
jgi:hypothetical protein